ncbi:methyl-accepting chemotaxis protein [Halonatronum saccharophilum]|uniref:methyl-accepting chemotaxis protein n=1 Tax=Halonatronum saccharophilum TaxID=150060 RepID=UPI0004B91432|nr:methyl-accepting chemotaxis protein [Halonatronum saccharophilum]
MNKFSIRVKIIISILISSFLISTLVSIVATTNSQNLLEKEVEDKLVNMAANYANEFSQRFILIEESVEQFEEIIKLTIDVDKFKNDPKYIDEYKKKIIPIVKGFADGLEVSPSAYIYFNHQLLGEGHDVWYQDGNNDGYSIRQEEIPLEYFEDENRASSWYYNPIDAGRGLWSEPYETTYGKSTTLISYTKPIYKDNVLIGVAGMDFFFEDIKEAIESIIVYDSGYAWLHNQNFDYLIHPELEGQNLLELGARDYEFMAERMLTKRNGVIEYDYEGEDKILGYATLVNDWILAIGPPIEEILRSINRTRNLLIILIILGVLISTFIGYIVSLKITNSLNLAVGQCEEMANGDFTRVLGEEWTERGDEIGALAQGFNKITFAMKDVITNISNNVENLSAYSEELSASGNQVGDGASQVTQSIQEIALGAEESTVQIAEINQKIEDLISEIEEIEDKTKEMTNVSSSALEYIEKGNQSVNKSVKVINEVKDDTKEVADIIFDLGETSNQINCIVGLIDDIADQTSLLSLNATIEAARAKEHGEGFAVVAEEIRNLANETSEATNNIADLINNMQNKVNKAVKKMKENKEVVRTGVARIEETGTSFKDIQEVVNKLSSIICDVTASTENMTANSKEAKEKVDNIAEVTEEFAANTEEVSASSEEQSAATEEIISASYELSEMAQTLQNLVEKFKV